jgi:hypothetical protein
MRLEIMSKGCGINLHSGYLVVCTSVQPNDTMTQVWTCPDEPVTSAPQV